MKRLKEPLPDFACNATRLISEKEGRQEAINKIFLDYDESHLYPVNGKFNVTKKAIQNLSNQNLKGLEYCLALDNEISRLVNKQV